MNTKCSLVFLDPQRSWAFSGGMFSLRHFEWFCILRIQCKSILNPLELTARCDTAEYKWTQLCLTFTCRTHK